MGEAIIDVGELLQQHLIKAKQVTDAIGARLRPQVLDVDDILPAVTYEITSTADDHDLSGASGSAATRILFRSYGKTQRDANRVAHILYDLLDGKGKFYLGENNEIWVEDCIRDNKWDAVEQPSPGSSDWLHIRNQDFVLTHTQPEPSLAPIE